MEDVRDLKELQLDALREVANIGAGHAATALSQMTNRTIMIAVPEVNVRALEDVTDLVGRDDDGKGFGELRCLERRRDEAERRVRRNRERRAAAERRDELARSRPRGGALQHQLADELEQLATQVRCAARLLQEALEDEPSALERRSEQHSLLLGAERLPVPGEERALGRGPRLLGVEQEAVEIEDDGLRR